MTYLVRNWSKLYENNRTRDLKRLDWVPIPNKHDGDGYTLIMEQKNGAAIFGAWIAIVQVASRCDPRGTLLRDGGKPHDSTSLSRMTRIPEPIVKEALKLLSSPDLNWLEVTGVENLSGGEDLNPAPSCGNPASECHEGKGREVNGTEGKEPLMSGKPDDAVEILHYLNEKAGREYRDIETHLKLIRQRLSEEGVDVSGVKTMIDRQVLQWKGTEMDTYLRPITLFAKLKFATYYDTRNLAATTYGNNRQNPAKSPKPDFTQGDIF